MMNPTVVAILDDEPELGKALGRLLGQHGYSVELFCDAASFLAAQSEAPSDCLLLDLQMPGTDGFAVLEQLAEPSYAHIPVVIVTGRDQPDYRERASRLGAAAYLTKPVDEVPLLDAIHACLAAD